jgi:hypothetical protein
MVSGLFIFKAGIIFRYHIHNIHIHSGSVIFLPSTRRTGCVYSIMLTMPTNSLWSGCSFAIFQSAYVVEKESLQKLC